MKHFAHAALTLALDGEVGVLTLNRPDRRNAIGAAMWQALPEALRAVAADAAMRVLVVRGAGSDFAAGADIAEFDQVFADRAATLHYARVMGEALSALAACPKPTLALIDGHCIGAGVALALSCDIRCASADGRFGVTPARLGLVYPLADTARLVRAVGESKARDLLYTGRLFDADEALAMRLVDEVHAPARFEAAVFDKARLIAAQSAGSVARAKAVVALIAAGATVDTEQTRGWFADAAESEDHRQRLQAFRARRG